MKITAENYFDSKTNLAYVDYSTYKNFVGSTGLKGCECRALAIAKGEYVRPKTTSLLVGGYVDAFFDGSLDRFKKENPECFKKGKKSKADSEQDEKELKSDFVQADIMIERALREPLFMRYLAGKTQLILTAELAGEYEVFRIVRRTDPETGSKYNERESYVFNNEKDAKRKRDELNEGISRNYFTLCVKKKGVPVRCKLDSFDGYRITDLKTAQSITQTFYAADGERHNFVEHFDYISQAVFYTEAVKQNYGLDLPYYLAVISKEKAYNVPHPRLAIIHIPPQKIAEQKIQVERNLPKVWALLQGEMEPIPCGTCEWCADNLPVDKVISLDELLLDI